MLNLQKNKELILSESLGRLNETSGLKIKFGFEIEFYVRVSGEGDNLPDDNLVNSFFELVNNGCRQIDLFDKIYPEKGIFQCEFKTKASEDIKLLLNDLDEISKHIDYCCKKLNLIAIYDPRPFLDDCGNAFQVNFSLNDENGINIFANGSKVTSEIADFVAFYINESFIFANKNDEDFLRYDSVYNKLIFGKGKFVAPTSVNWGYDNRSCALRVLNAKSQKNDARIEVRVASNHLNKELFLASITLILAKFFSSQKFQKKDYKIKNEAIFGNAFDDNYVQNKFPVNMDEALDCFLEGGVIFPQMKELL